MSQMTLEEFFESVRPCKYHMCIIVKAVLITLKSGPQVMLDTEHIRYDAYNGKVYMSKRNRWLSAEKYRDSVSGFFDLLCGVCRHAGDGTEMFMQKLCVLAQKGEYDACIDITAEYISFYREMNSKNIIIYILCSVTVILYEVIFLLTMNIKFY